MFLRDGGAFIVIPFLAALTVNIFAAVVGCRHAGWNKRAPLLALGVVLLSVVGMVIPALPVGIRMALGWATAVNLALLPNLIWLAMVRTWSVQSRLVGAVVFAGIGAYIFMLAAVAVSCGVTGDCL